MRAKYRPLRSGGHEEDYGLGLYDLEEGTVMCIPDVTFIQARRDLLRHSIEDTLINTCWAIEEREWELDKNLLKERTLCLEYL